MSANSIIGVGPEPFDCGLACDVNGGLSAPPAPVYYASCSSASGCQPVFASCGSECQDSTADQQVTNPVIGFGTDNNGTVIAMTPPAGGAAPTATGTSTFGIGTETNNALTAANILTLNQSDEFETAFEGQSLFASFIDSGSNALFFPNWPSLKICSDNPDFYCPSSPAALSAVNIGTNNFQSAVNFTVDNADTLFSNSGAQAFNNLAGPEQAGSSPATCVNNNGTSPATAPSTSASPSFTETQYLPQLTGKAFRNRAHATVVRVLVFLRGELNRSPLYYSSPQIT